MKHTLPDVGVTAQLMQGTPVPCLGLYPNSSVGKCEQGFKGNSCFSMSCWLSIHQKADIPIIDLEWLLWAQTATPEATAWPVVQI